MQCPPSGRLLRPDERSPRAFDTLQGVADEVFGVEAADVERAKAIVLGKRRLSPRDALHAAVMERARVGRIMGFDRGFDALPGVPRLGA